jgi:rhodanese-related sulfurtransferase
MRKLRYFILIAILFCWAAAVVVPASDAADVPTISKEKVKTMLGKPNAIVVDVRVEPEWDSSKFKIKGAIRKDPRKVENWFGTLPKKKTLVFYCA